jgi:hypothetical protein
MINPSGLSLRDWADSVVLAAGSSWAFGRLDDETRWKEWATGFVRARPFAQRGPPDPNMFDDWRDWAMLAYPMLEG